MGTWLFPDGPSNDSLHPVNKESHSGLGTVIAAQFIAKRDDTIDFKVAVPDCSHGGTGVSVASCSGLELHTVRFGEKAEKSGKPGIVHNSSLSLEKKKWVWDRGLSI